MIATLTLKERRIGLGLSGVLAVLGLAMAAAGRTGPMAVHGGMAMVLGLMLIFAIGGALYDHPERSGDRLTRHYDARQRASGS